MKSYYPTNGQLKWPIIGHLYRMTSFFMKHYKMLPKRHIPDLPKSNKSLKRTDGMHKFKSNCATIKEFILNCKCMDIVDLNCEMKGNQI